MARAGEGGGEVAGASGPLEHYEAGFKRVELSDVAAKTKHMPAEFIEGHNNVSKAFLDYARPLVGELPRFERL
ncbi:MAG: hypothetical protein AAFY58_07450 [Planctomycetota bacterium]